MRAAWAVATGECWSTLAAAMSTKYRFIWLHMDLNQITWQTQSETRPARSPACLVDRGWSEHKQGKEDATTKNTNHTAAGGALRSSRAPRRPTPHRAADGEAAAPAHAPEGSRHAQEVLHAVQQGVLVWIVGAVLAGDLQHSGDGLLGLMGLVVFVGW